MKVLHATTAVGWSGGTEQCLLLAEWMRKMGHDAHILTVKGSELDHRAERAGIPRVYFPGSERMSLKKARQLANLIHRYDVVNTHISKAQWLVWLALRFVKRKPRVFYTRRVPYPISPLSALTKYNLGVDGVIGVTPEICERLKRYPFISKKVHFITSGIDLERFNPRVESNLRKELSIPRQTVVFANIGNFSKVKGHHILLPAFRRLLEAESENLLLILAGRDTTQKACLDLIKNLGLERHVLPLGFRRDIPEILKITDVFVFPSIKEGHAGSLVQAMAMEKIVVASHTGGIKCYLKHMENGIAVRPGSIESLYGGMLTALENLKNEKMRKKARETAEKFDIRRVAEETIKLYMEVMK